MATDPAFPPEAATWLPVGAFVLSDGVREVEVRTFAAHSEDPFDGAVCVTIHAYYQAAGGAWQHATAFNCRRISWDGVGRVSPNGVELVFQHRPGGFIRLDQPPRKPPGTFTHTLVLESGVPRVKW